MLSILHVHVAILVVSYLMFCVLRCVIEMDNNLVNTLKTDFFVCFKTVKTY